MKRHFLSLILLICAGPTLPAQDGILSGRVTYQNSRHRPVPGAIVKANLGNNTETDTEGGFSMTLPGKKAGYEVRISVEKEGLEVVNKEKLQRYALRVDETVPLEIYMCPIGQWEKNALAYYHINERKITARYRQQVASLKEDIADQKVLVDSLATLAENHRLALNQAEKLAEKFAITNLDDASILFKKAFTHFSQGEIDSALLVLDETRLDELVQALQKEEAEAIVLEDRAKAKRDTAAKTKAEVIQGYTIRAEMLISLSQFDEGLRNFAKAVALDSLDFDLNNKYAYALQNQNRFGLATQKFQHLLSLAQDSAQKAIVLNNLGILYKDQNEYKKGVEAHQEALNIRRRLAKANPDVYLWYVAQSLNNLGSALSGLEEYEDVLILYEEALAIRRKLADSDPKKYAPLVAESLNNLGNTFTDLNDYEKAIPTYDESLKIQRKQTGVSSEADSFLLATTLMNLGIALGDINSYERGISSFEEALEIQRNLSNKNRDVYLPSVASTLLNLGNTYAKFWKSTLAISALEESLQYYRELSEVNPKVYFPHVAHCLSSLGAALIIKGEFQAAISRLEKAREIYQNLFQVNSEAYAYKLVSTLTSLGLGLNNNLERDSAIAVLKESLKLSQKYYPIKKEVFLDAISGSTNILALVYFQKGSYQTALRYAQEGVFYLTELAQKSIDKYCDQAAAGYMLLTMINFNLDKVVEANEAIHVVDSLLQICPDMAKKDQLQVFTNFFKTKIDSKLKKVKEDLSKREKTAEEFKQKVMFFKQSVEVFEKQYAQDSSNQGFRLILIQAYDSLSRSQLFIRDFAGAELSARKGLNIAPQDPSLTAHLSHAVLFQGCYEIAKALYLSFKGKAYDSERSWKEIFLQDLDKLEAAGITHPAAEKIKKLWKERWH